MAITSSTQIFDDDAVIKTLSKLDNAISNLNMAKQSLNNAKSKCNDDVLKVNNTNTFPTKIQRLIYEIDSEIQKCRTLKTNITTKAKNLYQEDFTEYQAYLEELENKEGNK